ncbi:hypothetical protein Ddc_15482 [Ditylenchus destructor]|nr:hypothetical protein Ddc_15482 [Ditylenchus destructor]
MARFSAPPTIIMFDNELSIEAYNEWVIRNHYSKQVPCEAKATRKPNLENDRTDMYELCAYANYNHPISDPNRPQTNGQTAAFFVRVEFNHENWPLVHHFARLLSDPFIYVRSMEVTPDEELLKLLTEVTHPDHSRLQCKVLTFNLSGNFQEYFCWIKEHILCNELKIYDDSNSNYDEELLDILSNGAHCTSVAIMNCTYDLSNVVAGLVQKFMDLLISEENQIVETIRLSSELDQGIVEALKCKYAKFAVEEEKSESGSTEQIIVFINKSIEKKLVFTYSANINDTQYYYLSFPYYSLQIKNF